MTRSAQSRSRSVSSSALRLMRRMFQRCGSSAATVISPSGGAGQRAPQISQTGCRFQNEFGLNLGNTIKTLGVVIWVFVLGAIRPAPAENGVAESLFPASIGAAWPAQGRAVDSYRTTLPR